MRRIFTSAFALFCAFAASAQCSVATTGTVNVTNTFNGGNTEGFTGDFTLNSQRLQSSNVGTGTTKVLTSPIYFLDPNTTEIRLRFDLGGNASVSSYTISARTAGNPNIPICSGTTLSAGTNFITATKPAALPTGVNFQLVITFTISGGNGNSINIDNFGFTAQAAAGTLPVHFTGITARLLNGDVNLNWTVDAEEALNGYEVEKSADGRTFAKIGFVAAAGQRSYSFTDRNYSATAYYRVKSVDIDGKFQFTSVVSMKGGKSGVVLKAFPTVATSSITVQHDAAVKGSIITIASQEGRIAKSVNPASGAQQTVVDLSSLQSGIYLVRFADGNGNVETVKVVKQ